MYEFINALLETTSQKRLSELSARFREIKQTVTAVDEDAILSEVIHNLEVVRIKRISAARSINN